MSNAKKKIEVVMLPEPITDCKESWNRKEVEQLLYNILSNADEIVSTYCLEHDGHIEIDMEKFNKFINQNL